MAVYGYTRVSTAEQINGQSLDGQARAVEAMAMARNATLDQLFTDPGVSGSTPWEKRPQGGKLLAIVEPGDTVVVAKLDRAFRNASDALTKADWLASCGVDLVIADMGPDPVTGNGVGRLFFTMLAALAEFERDRTRERTEEGRRTKASRGGHVGGHAPFGFRVVGSGKASRLEPIPEQQEAVDTILYCRDTLGMSMRQTADYALQEHGVRISHTAVGRVQRTAAALDEN